MTDSREKKPIAISSGTAAVDVGELAVEVGGGETRGGGGGGRLTHVGTDDPGRFSNLRIASPMVGKAVATMSISERQEHAQRQPYKIFVTVRLVQWASAAW